MVAGVDVESELRRGDLSATGIYFELDEPCGVVGSVQRLRLESPDRQCQVVVMARIVRIIMIDDVERETLRSGIAMEFMAETLEKYAALQGLVDHALRMSRAEQSADLAHRASASAALRAASPGGTAAHAAAQGLGLSEAAVRSPPAFQHRVKRMTLETTWPVKLGEAVQLVFRSAGTRSRIPFEGVVRDVRDAPCSSAADVRYVVDVQLQPPGTRLPSFRQYSATEQPSITDSVDLIFADILGQGAQAAANGERRRPRREHLVGVLSRIRLSSLLMLFEMERTSGEMRVSGADGDRVHLFLSAGQIVDVETDGRARPAWELLREVLRWKDGTFDFSMGNVDRPDRIGISTAALLLDFARLDDEAHRGAGDDLG